MCQIHERMIPANRKLLKVEEKATPKVVKSSSKANVTVPQLEPFTEIGQQLRISFVEGNTDSELKYLAGKKKIDDLGQLKGNIENFVGMSQIPTGIMGPLVINTSNGVKSTLVPLATSEGTLVASYARGARACRNSGEIRSLCLKEGVQRSPIFQFKNLDDLSIFLDWCSNERTLFDAIVKRSSNYAELKNIDINVEGNQVILNLEFTTGDAAGQNMVTIASQAICQHIIKSTPVQPEIWFLESNASGDKKATFNSFANVRGKKVTSEIVLKKEVINSVLKTSPELMFKYWQTSFMGAVKCGAIGAQGHFSNGLAALFIACGQDAACVSEASVGITRMEVNKDGDLYSSVTLPNLIVGTIGGGTSLPTQKECLEIMGCYGEGKAKTFAEICGAVCLAGEISIIAALSAGQFAAAHQKHGRA